MHCCSGKVTKKKKIENCFIQQFGTMNEYKQTELELKATFDGKTFKNKTQK